MKAVIIVVLLLAVLILPLFIKSLRYDFINHGGNGPSSSISKEESIERGVFVCDLELVSFRVLGDSLDFKIKEAWVEKIWRRGAWYWTTIPEDNTGYRIAMLTTLTVDQENNLNLINDRMSALGNYEGLGCADGRCSGTMKELPKSDTIRYNVLRRRNLDFGEANIIGELVLVLKRR